MSEMETIIIDYETTGRKIPKWALTVFRNGDEVFFPSFFVGNERSVFLAACFDGVHFVRHKNHIYLPADWIIKECPDVAAEITRIRDRIVAGEETI